MTDGAIDVVGLLGGAAYGAAGSGALAAAEVVVGAPRQLDEVDVPPGAEVVTLRGPLDAVLATIDERAARGARVCVLASGDPGFFGIVRALGARVGATRLAVHPAPSSVAVAFARLGLPWDDATVASAHGRPLGEAVRVVARAAKAAVLTSPDNPPEAVARALIAAGRPGRETAAVVSRLGGDGERVVRAPLDEVASGRFDPLSVVVLPGTQDASAGPGLSWGGRAPADVAFGLPEGAYVHRDGMITKAEVRAVVLAKLALPSVGVLWDVGAGSGSVGVECARLAPGLDVVAVERAPDQAARVRVNATAHGVVVSVVEGTAPAVLAGLDPPDRAFVGGGGIDVLDAVQARLRPGGVVVATYAVVERAVAARARLGSMVQVNVARAAPLGDLGARLDPENPVFVCWGPTP